MIDAAVLEQIEQLRTTIARLEHRVEDLEDLRALEQAILKNGDKPLIPWDQAKRQLDVG
jgi:hypothetical protein